MKSLPSFWNGVTFRSRTEARWACFFDRINLKWEYEPEGFLLSDGTTYLPDFWLPEMEMWAEVKPTDGPTKEERSKVELLVRDTGKPCIVLPGSPWPAAYQVCYPEGYGDGYWWNPACFSDAYTVPGHRDPSPRLYTDPEGFDIVECNPMVTLEMAASRRANFRDPRASDYLPVGWEGIELPF